jgi:hypothetical protein
MTNRAKPVEFYRDAMHMAFSEAGFPHAEVSINYDHGPEGDIGVSMPHHDPGWAFLHAAYHVTGWVPVESCEVPDCPWRNGKRTF